MSFSHLPRALARSSTPSAHALRRPAYSSRVPLNAARRPPVTFNRASIRWASTSSAPRTWGQRFRSGIVRVLLAGGAVYFYCTSPYFEPRSDRYAFRPEPLIPPPVVEDAPTLESLAAERKARKAKEEEQLAALAAKPQSEDGSPADPAKAEGELEEKSQAGAFNPETGEINWDCPCLGGMADGPCGENFKAAFSCFVFSQEEPKGMDCIDKFKAMQDCFREHPDVYGEELADDEEGAEAPENAVGEQQAVLKQQPEERPSAGQLAEDRKPAEEQSEDFLPPGRGLYEGKAILAEREAAKQSRVEAEPKDAPAPRQSATPASSDAQSGESSK